MGKGKGVGDGNVGEVFFARMGLFWGSIFYLSLGLGLVSAYFDRDAGRGDWGIVAALGLSIASAALFQRLDGVVFSRGGRWPMQSGSAWVYFGGQLVILAALLSLDESFIGLGFALMGQAFGALRPRHWALPILPLLVLLARPLGLADDVLSGDWLRLAWFVLTMAIWLLIATLIWRLFQQRARLLGLVAELRRAKAQLELSAAQAEELAVLRERTRLARAMHDSLGHALVSVNVKLEAAQRLYRVAQDRGDAELEATRALVRETMGELRRSLADLRAPLPDHHDLPAALGRLAAEYSARGGLEVQLAAGAGTPTQPELAETLFLIAREALSNVERHAGATHAELELSRLEHGWLLRVADNGAGLRSGDLQRPGHFGVVGMRERASALGGTLHVEPRQGGGTVVEASLPAGRVDLV